MLAAFVFPLCSLQCRLIGIWIMKITIFFYTDNKIILWSGFLLFFLLRLHGHKVILPQQMYLQEPGVLSESDILLRPRFRLKCKMMFFLAFNSLTTSVSINRQIKTFKVIHNLHLQSEFFYQTLLSKATHNKYMCQEKKKKQQYITVGTISIKH